MIEKNTVLILGAGASRPYGFPTGEELLQRITTGSTLIKIRRIHQDHVGKWNQIKEQYDELKHIIIETAPESIDILISRQPRLERIGKFAVTVEILEAEKQSAKTMFHGDPKHWYTKLFQKMTDEVTNKNEIDILTRNRLSIVSFNYDRSLEYRLRYLFERFLEVRDNDPLIEYFNSLKIIHVYGRVGDPFDEGANDHFEYGGDYTRDNVEKLSKSINVMYSTRSEEKKQEIAPLLHSAEQIFFLGFGYHASNMDYLNLETWKKRLNNRGTLQNYFGTSLNAATSTIGRLMGNFKSPGGLQYPVNTTIFEPCDCIDLIKNYL